MKKLIKEYRSFFEKNNIRSIIEKNNQKILDPNFWKDKTSAQKVIKEKNFQYPCVIGETNSELREVFSKAEFRDFENLTNVRELREQFLGKIS